MPTISIKKVFVVVVYIFFPTGNHESVYMNQMFGFEGEVKAKYPFE